MGVGTQGLGVILNPAAVPTVTLKGSVQLPNSVPIFGPLNSITPQISPGPGYQVPIQIPIPINPVQTGSYQIRPPIQAQPSVPALQPSYHPPSVVVQNLTPPLLKLPPHASGILSSALNNQLPIQSGPSAPVKDLEDKLIPKEDDDTIQDDATDRKPESVSSQEPIVEKLTPISTKLSPKLPPSSELETPDTDDDHDDEDEDEDEDQDDEENPVADETDDDNEESDSEEPEPEDIAESNEMPDNDQDVQVESHEIQEEDQENEDEDEDENQEGTEDEAEAEVPEEPIKRKKKIKIKVKRVRKMKTLKAALENNGQPGFVSRSKSSFKKGSRSSSSSSSSGPIFFRAGSSSSSNRGSFSRSESKN